MIEFILLAGIALFVGWRLFVTLGQDQGPPEGRSRVPTPTPAPNQDNTAPAGGDVVPLRPSFTGPGAAGMEAIHDADPSFDPRLELLHGDAAAHFECFTVVVSSHEWSLLEFDSSFFCKGVNAQLIDRPDSGGGYL